MSARHVIVVGASLAGTRTARALREQGFTGRLTLVGDEPHPPYDRPPLSKRILDGDRWTDADGTVGDTAEDLAEDLAEIALPTVDDLDVELRAGVAAVALRPADRTLLLTDGDRLRWDGLVVATGAAARPWPTPAPAGVHTLRTLDDARALRRALAAPDARLLVVGAGFLGSEVAAAAVRRGVPVTLVEAGTLPLVRAVGTAVGEFVARLHREAGIDLRTGTRVRSLTGTDRVTGAHLDDGTHVPATVVLAALGAVPRTAWLRGSGLLLDGAVVCDEFGRALAEDGTVVPGVVAVGDASRRPHPLAPGTLHLGHWSAAVEHSALAARVLLRREADGAPPEPPATVPSFWSDLHGVRIRSLGLPHLADEARTVEYDPPGRRLVVSYHRAGEPVGVLAVNRAGRLAAHRPLLVEAVRAARRRAAVPPVA
ncbi:NAD(P)/FAD-dependent oxidoreductase [Streptomyces sp. TRM43335]|uniref:NAD(P)/FAD-dependent oxidoreductase n=1 Tax=Streptomyces taklimakanensis TaxID=2569853 RepID=A0A6G2BA79_9ACTN|nr:NAD(P)/FAD-dependent oxidoreductase [Streptomyces taklimakanensis]